MLKVFGDHNSGNCFKVRLLLEQLAIPYTWIPVDILKGESRTPEFLAKFPNGQIPAVEFVDGRRLTESNAILNYFADGTPLLPEDRFERAQVLQWMFFEQYTHEPSVASARYIVRYLKRPPEHEKVLQKRIAEGLEAIAVMERHLTNNQYFVGSRYTIADIALYAYTHVAHEGLIDISPFSAVSRWIAAVKAQPRYVEMGAAQSS
jgi:glutathione S-transferase